MQFDSRIALPPPNGGKRPQRFCLGSMSVLVELTTSVCVLAVAVAICATRLGLLPLLCTKLATICKGPNAKPCSWPSGDTAKAVPMVITKSKLMAAMVMTHLRPFGGRTVRGRFLWVARITAGWRNDVVLLLPERGVKVPVWRSGKPRVTPGDVACPGRLLVLSVTGSAKGPETPGLLV